MLRACSLALLLLSVCNEAWALIAKLSNDAAASASQETVLKRHSRLDFNAYSGLDSVNVWPRPNKVEFGSAFATVSPALQFKGNISDALVRAAIERYKELIFPHAGAINGDIKTIAVKLLSGGSPEGYQLRVSPSSVEIVAAQPVGVQYALETFSQLVTFDFDKMVYSTQAVLPLKIEDEPRFPHRGLLVDTSRHFLSLPLLKRVITSMSFAKLNRLHWHVTDAQSFPINSRVEPALASKGAWSQRERYTPEDVDEVVRHATLHGITVVPEFDMPGHTKSWGEARPDLMASTMDRFGDGNSAALDPTKEETYQLVQKVLKDWLVGTKEHPAFFKKAPFVHLGTDEVPYNAWLTLGSPTNLFANFVTRALNIVKSFGKEVILWEEAFKDGSAPEQAIIQVWLNPNLARQATNAGHRVILSEGWYLDHLDNTAEAMYNRNPANLVSAGRIGLLMGGEGCMWGETVDGGDLEETIWPRMGAVAERLWSSDQESWWMAKSRLAAFRCLLLERGIPAGTLEGHGRSVPPGPGSCGSQ